LALVVETYERIFRFEKVFLKYTLKKCRSRDYIMRGTLFSEKFIKNFFGNRVEKLPFLDYIVRDIF